MEQIVFIVLHGAASELGRAGSCLCTFVYIIGRLRRNEEAVVDPQSKVDLIEHGA